jgi:hypothetical protein
LSPDPGVDKKQAPGFEHAPPSASRAGSEPSAGDRAARPEARSGGARASASPLAWPGGKQVFKAVLVIAATAVSLYLLRRRFF